MIHSLWHRQLLGRGTSTILLSLILVLSYRLFEPITLAIYREDVTMMRKAIQQGSGHSFALKDLEQKFGFCPAEG